MRVALDGPDAAGKTTLAEELAAVLAGRGRNVVRASVDGFHRPRAERHRRGRDSPEGYYLDAFDYDAVRTALLFPLGPGGDRRYRAAAFDLDADTPLPEAWAVAPADAVALVDGVFLQRAELADLWDVRVFVDAGVGERRRRACERAGSEAVLTRYDRRYLPAQRLYEAEARPRQLADAVVDNTDPVVPRLL